MSNIKFTYKFALVFLVLALATVVAGGFGLLQLSKINAFSEDFSSKWLPGITDVNAILADVNTMRRAEIQHTLTELNEEKLPEEDTIKAAKLKISEAANKYKTIIQADNDDGKFDEFQKVLTRYYAADKTLLDLSNKLPPDPISTGAFLNGESQSALRALLKALDAMVVHSNSQADVATVSAKSSYEAARLGLITVVVVTCLAAIVLGIWITRLITKPLAFAVNAAQGYSKGDLSLALEVHGTDELSLLLHAMEDMRKSLARVVSSTRNNSVLVANASAEIAHGNQDLSARTESQASALEETAASMEELSSQVKHNAENAHQANQLASNASITAVRGGEVVGRVVDTMKEINVSSRKISEIISVIDGIAFQTNILALNAAVEAARAGEQGRGFAVVASEVRSLAGRSADAAKEIKNLINASVEKVKHGTALVDEAGSTMTEVVGAIRHVSAMVGEISAASSQQAAGVAQIGESVSQMDQVTQQNAALVEQMAAAASSLRSQANALVETVETFKLDGNEPAARGQPASNLPKITLHEDHGRRIATTARTQPKPVAARPTALPRPVTPAKTVTLKKDDDWETF